MIFLSTAVGSLDGTVAIKELPDSDMKTNTARVLSAKTLDGGTVVSSSGTTVLDSELVISAYISKEIETKLWSLFYGFTSFIFVTGVSCYQVAIKKLNTNSGKLIMNLLIMSDKLEE